MMPDYPLGQTLDFKFSPVMEALLNMTAVVTCKVQNSVEVGT